jgi:serine/threonine protein kinase
VLQPLDEDLPEELVDDALAAIACAQNAERARVIDELVAEHPGHALALRALCAAVSSTEALLALRFGRCDTGADPIEIGPYRVLRRLGAGAFGVVYRCAQTVPIRREVAVKVLRPGVGDVRTLARFEIERQVLVGLQHECIASVLDAGALADGRPYFAMPIVEGAPITEHCDRARLSIAMRLRLFVDLCAGVQHAHLRGVIHRDLKPANVLVAVHDGRAVPKIIDFGIAKLAHAANEAAGPAVGTLGARVVGTPGYMSPEQAIGASHEVHASRGQQPPGKLAGPRTWALRRSQPGGTGFENPFPPPIRRTFDVLSTLLMSC